MAQIELSPAKAFQIVAPSPPCSAFKAKNHIKSICMSMVSEDTVNINGVIKLLLSYMKHKASYVWQVSSLHRISALTFYHLIKVSSAVKSFKLKLSIFKDMKGQLSLLFLYGGNTIIDLVLTGEDKNEKNHIAKLLLPGCNQTISTNVAILLYPNLKDQSEYQIKGCIVRTLCNRKITKTNLPIAISLIYSKSTSYLNYRTFKT